MTLVFSPGWSLPRFGQTVKSSLLTTSSSCLSTVSVAPLSAQYSGSRCMSLGNWNALGGEESSVSKNQDCHLCHKSNLANKSYVSYHAVANHSVATSPVFSITRWTMLLPEFTGAAPKLKSATARVCTRTRLLVLCLVAMA